MKYTYFSTFGNFKTNLILTKDTLNQISTKVASLNIPNVKLAMVQFNFQERKDLHPPFFHIVGSYKNKRTSFAKIKSQEQFNQFIGENIKNAIQKIYFLNFHIFNVNSYIIDITDAPLQQDVKIYPE